MENKNFRETERQSNSRRHEFFAGSVRYVEDLLARELLDFGASNVRETRAGVYFNGTLETAYRACLWSRVASRILLPLKTFPAASPEALYQGAAQIPWQDHLSADGTLAVDCSLSHSTLRHSVYAAQVVKDAVVDCFRARGGRRPSVSLQRPDVRLNLHLHQDRAVVSVDLSGESLHRRTYRKRSGKAPLKENIAAAVLLRAHWAEIAESGGGFVDPLCGSATLPIEAALLAADCPPGLSRAYFGFLGWKGHDGRLWRELCEEGKERFAAGRRNLPLIVGYDRDPEAVRAARENVERASLQNLIRIQRQELDRLGASEYQTGLVATNPPYGERLDDDPNLPGLYMKLGRVLKAQYPGWKAAVLTAHTELAKSIGLQAFRRNTLYNGTIKCTLVQIDLVVENRLADTSAGERTAGRIEAGEAHRSEPGDSKPAASGSRLPEAADPGAVMFANRLKKNRKRLRRWLRSEGISCYRVYDADMPEYAVAVDVYENRWIHVQEYAPPLTVEPETAQRRLQEAMAVLPEVLEIDAADIFLKIRERQRGRRQYMRMNSRDIFHEVREGGFRFLVNFEDYLDTGLFLDHRPTRRLIQDLAGGRRFLNLFCYTASATVYAAKGGAVGSTSVDSSRRYLAWAKKNLLANGVDPDDHELVRADCLKWLRSETGRYGLIFVDPPTFSNSKDRTRVFEVQRDHVELIHLALKHLEPNGTLIFSTNYRKFKLDEASLSRLKVESLTEATRPPDFAHRRPHQCWKIAFTGARATRV